MLVLGVDGGGTKTLAALADQSGAVVSSARGRDTNPLTQPDWRDHLARTVTDAVGGRAASVVGAAFGLPVYGEVRALSEQQSAAARSLMAGATVRNDVHTAHEGAFAGGPGVLLLAGTGSMCWAAETTGRIGRVGGWGDGFGDEGSAHSIGLAALACTSRIVDGRLAGSAFADAILAAVGVDRAALPEGLINWFYHNPNRRPAVAALAATVDALAADGDLLASTLLDEAADALALHVAAARRQLPLAGPDWCFVGGVSRSTAMRNRLATRLGALTAPILPPVGGALWRAASEAGWAPDADWIGRLHDELATRLEPAGARG